MTKASLKKRLNSGRISMEVRDELVEALLSSPGLVETMLDEILEEDKNGTFNAGWVLDNAMRKKLDILLPHLDEFCNVLKKIRSESVIRPMAHVCELLVLCYFKKKNASCIKSLNDAHLERITETCFDWLIGDHKVASKVFAMTSLFYLGDKFEWVRPELKLVLENTIAEGSVGFQNRAMKTLKMLKGS